MHPTDVRAGKDAPQVMVYASSLSKEGSRKDGTVLELRPGRVHAGGHSSYVSLRSIRFPSLDGDGDSPQPSPAQPPHGTLSGSPQPSEPPADLAAPDASSETTLSHWAAKPAVHRLSTELASGLTLSVMPEGQSPPHATPGRLVRANSADACSPETASRQEDFTFRTASDDGAGVAAGLSGRQTLPAAVGSGASAPAAGPDLQLQLPGPPSSHSGAPSEACSRSSSPGRPPRIWRASAGWWPDGGQPPPPPPKVG